MRLSSLGGEKIKTKRQVTFFQANLTIQEAKLNVAQNDLNEAQAQLDEKQAELDKVQAMYDKAVQEKQVKLVEHRLSLFQGAIFKRVNRHWARKNRQFHLVLLARSSHISCLPGATSCSSSSVILSHDELTVPFPFGQESLKNCLFLTTGWRFYRALRHFMSLSVENPVSVLKIPQTIPLYVKCLQSELR